MAHRTFLDSLGRTWEVWDVTPGKSERRDLSRPAIPPDSIAADRRTQAEYRVVLGPDLANGWLAFQTAGEKRRLTPIPADWERLPTDELQQLWDEATEVTPPRRLIE